MSPLPSPSIPLAPLNASSQDPSNGNPTRGVVSSNPSTHSSRSSTLPIPGAFSPTPRAATPIPPQRPPSQHSSITNSSFHTPPPLVSLQPTATPPMDPKQPISSVDLFGPPSKQRKQGWCSMKWERCKDRCSDCCSNCQCEVSFGVGMDI